MPSYKLIYFDIRGRAEISRVLFALAGQEYEDVRLTQEEWAKMKESTGLIALPALEIDGKIYPQSIAISSYLAREFGFYGENNRDALQIEVVVGFVNDFVNAVIKAMYEKDESRKPELMKNFQEVDIPKYMGALEKILKENGTGYFVGNKMTYADILVWEFLFGLNERMSGVYEKYEAIKAMCDKVANDPKIKAYVAKRKPTAN